MGRPKALVHDADGASWLQHAVEVLRDGGCDGVTVVLGAGADEAVRLLDGLGVDVVVAHDWDEGMSASLRSGLESLKGSDVEAAVVSLVDLPDLTAAVVRRVLSEREGDEALARASYHGRPGHPVVLGRAHWQRVAGAAMATPAPATTWPPTTPRSSSAVTSPPAPTSTPGSAVS